MKRLNFCTNVIAIAPLELLLYTVGVVVVVFKTKEGNTQDVTRLLNHPESYIYIL